MVTESVILPNISFCVFVCNLESHFGWVNEKRIFHDGVNPFNLQNAYTEIKGSLKTNPKRAKD